MYNLTHLRLMYPIILKQLRISDNLLLTLILLSHINLRVLNILLIEFYDEIIPCSMKLVWYTLIQTICATILRQHQVRELKLTPTKGLKKSHMSLEVKPIYLVLTSVAGGAHLE